MTADEFQRRVLEQLEQMGRDVEQVGRDVAVVREQQSALDKRFACIEANQEMNANAMHELFRLDGSIGRLEGIAAQFTRRRDTEPAPPPADAGDVQ